MNLPENLNEFLQLKKQEFLIARHQLFKEWSQIRQVELFMKQFIELNDRILKEIWQYLNFPEEVNLIAVGGYGRGELYPYSDLDILILLPDSFNKLHNLNYRKLNYPPSYLLNKLFKPHKNRIKAISPLMELNHKISTWTAALWDMGLTLGQTVCTLSECLDDVRENLLVETNLLERRYLSGGHFLFESLTQALNSSQNLHEFIDGKLQEQHHRHLKFSASDSNLEPNLKNNAGGLRDVHLWFWLSRAVNLGNRVQDFERHGWLTRHETRQLNAARRCLQSLRIDLHWTAQRKEDRLLWNYQSKLAEIWGLKDTKSSKASELLMQRYYRAARIIRQINDILLPQFRQNFLNSPKNINYHAQKFQSLSINAFFNLENGLLILKDRRDFHRYPHLILETFLLLSERAEILGIAPQTLRALWHARWRINARFRANPEHRAKFVAIFQQSSSVHRVLRLMSIYGILGRYLPAFGKIVGRMQHDLFHIHTVDEHTLRVIQHLRGFLDLSSLHTDPILARLMRQFQRPEILYLSGLFHDIAKGRQGDHSILGAQDALVFAEQHGLSSEDKNLLTWLVRAHLKFSFVAQKQDVYDPQVIESFAKFVKTPRRLIALYLLTVADIRATNPNLWNAWKAQLFDVLFHATLQQLKNGEKFDLNQSIFLRKQKAKELLNDAVLFEQMPEAVWKFLDENYFLRYSPVEIAWHSHQLAPHMQTESAQVWAKSAAHYEGFDVLVYAPDSVDLFSRICQFFSGTAYDIVDAKIHLTQHGYSLNTFHILAPFHQTIPPKNTIDFIETELKKQLSPTYYSPQSIQINKIDRHLFYFPIEPQIQFQIDDSNTEMTLFIIAGDRIGLLAQIAQLFAHYSLHVHSAKIMTLENRVEDTFVLSSPKLKRRDFLIEFKQELFIILNSKK